MRVSWKWLSELVDLSSLKNPEALGELLTSRGLEVEAIEPQGQGFDKVISAAVLETRPHPQADRLKVCQVDRGDGKPLEIVCGAPNVKGGQKVALAQIGAHLPNGVKIVESKIRGVTSQGMLCSEQELKLSEESEGILVLPESTPVGVSVAQLLGKDDTVLSLKLTANRSDCLSHLGIAREVASALGVQVKKPKTALLDIKSGDYQFSLAAGEDAPQAYTCFIQGVKIGPSPEWIVRKLEAVGSRSINNVVDATNYVLLELGFPMHAYDAKKLDGKQLQARLSNAGETLSLLDGSSVVLTGKELVIATGSDGKKAVGLAGVMGGGNSEVDSSTTDVVLECAQFQPSLVRRASQSFQKKTDAAHRFERGIDPEGLEFAISRLAAVILDLAGGKIAGATVQKTEGAKKKLRRDIKFNNSYLNRFLGFEDNQSPLTVDKVKALLEGLNCQVKHSENGWEVHPPSYRLDLNIKEDIAEEVARSIGYDQIPSTIPPLSGSPVFGSSALPQISLMDRAKDSLVKSGLSETVNFSFSNKPWLSRFGLASSVDILNPISEEYTVLIPSLIPGLVSNVLENWNHHFGSDPLGIRLFELRPVFSAKGEKIQAQGKMETGVVEKWKLAFAISGPRTADGLRSERGEVDFYDCKAVIDNLLTDMGARGIRYQPITQSRNKDNPLLQLFHPGKSVEILAGNAVAGYVGLMHPGKAKQLKTRAPLWIGEMDWESLARLSRGAFELPKFKAWPQFPWIERDFALLVRDEITADKVTQVGIKAGKPLAKAVKVFDIYKGSQVAQGMTSIAVRVIFYEEGRSLQESEAEAASRQILEAWKKEIQAELRG